MKNSVQDGKTIQYTVTGTAVKGGDVIVVGDLAGVAVTHGAIGETITLAIEGVYSLPKGAGAIDQGKKAYVNVTAGVTTIVGTATGNTFIGYAWSDAAAPDATVDVKLSF
jgi:predicted RecA/RadA family phage recombinase